MKKYFIFLLNLLLISGCSSTTSSFNSSSKNSISINSSSSTISTNSSISSSSSSSIVETVQLDTPSLKLNEDNGLVTFEKIENATYYEYIVNGTDIESTFNNFIELNDKSSLSVRACNLESYSEWSNAITYYDTSDVILEGSNKYHKVYFHNTNYDPIEVYNNTKVTKPIDPVKENYIFDNWYCDPFYKTIFDFNKPIIESTIIYANYNPTSLVDDVYYWIKANSLMSSSIQSNSSSWRFIPLKLDESSSIKEFSAIVNVDNASSSSPCYFLVMDGFDDNPGRTYYKNNNEDFAITSNGTYKITFSVETIYLLNGNKVNVKFELINNALSLNNNYNLDLDTPIIEVDGDNNRAFWAKVNKATSYEVIINNGISKIINTNSIELNKKDFICIRAIGNNSYSKWSVPNANINYLYEDDIKVNNYAYIYFYESNLDAYKVEIGEYINCPTIEKDGFEFKGWYLDLAKTKEAFFPYLVTCNSVFYPKFERKIDLYSKVYFNLVDVNNNILSILTWNYDNYDFYEYESQETTLEKDKDYYIVSLDDNKVYGPYKVNESGSYIVYFSLEHIWDIHTEKASNAYFAIQKVNIYFTNALNWDGTIYAYVWNSSSGEYLKSWPGKEMTYVKTNGYGQSIYSIQVNLAKYDSIIFSNGSKQTVDLSLKDAKDKSAFYTKDEKDNGKYKCGTYTYS